MIDIFLDSACAHPENILTQEAISSQVNLAFEISNTSEGSEMKGQLKNLEQTHYYLEFTHIFEKMANTDSTWKFWHQFVFNDTLAYICLFIAIQSGDYNLRVCSLKQMVPID